MDGFEETRVPSRMMRTTIKFEGESVVTEVGCAVGVEHKYRVYLEEEDTGYRYVVMQWPNRCDEYLMSLWLAGSLDREAKVEVYYPDPLRGESRTWIVAMSRAAALAWRDIDTNLRDRPQGPPPPGYA